MPAPPARRAVAGAGAALALVLGAGCAGAERSPVASPSPTPIAQLNTAAMELPRIDFCALVPGRAVTAALGGRADDSTRYGNGDRPDAAGLPRDVVHELGCSWSTDSGSSATAWVFARPVDVALARSVAAAAGRQAGCRLVQGPAFGTPAYAQECRLGAGAQRVRHAGLFGQTWLTCEVVAPAAVQLTEVRERADRWCVQVANALNTAE